MSDDSRTLPEDCDTHWFVNGLDGADPETIATVIVSPSKISKHPAFGGLLGVVVRAVMDPGYFDKILPHHEEQRALIEAVKAFVDKETELAAAGNDGEP